MSRARHDSYIGSLQEFYDIVSANRSELNPSAEDEMSAAAGGFSDEELPPIDLSPELLK